MIFTDVERDVLARAYAYILSWTDDEQQEAAHEKHADIEDGRAELANEPSDSDDPKGNNDYRVEETV